MSSTAMTVDLVLKGGKIATSTGVIEAGIAVDQGKIFPLAKRARSSGQLWLETLLPRLRFIVQEEALFWLRR